MKAALAYHAAWLKDVGAASLAVFAAASIANLIALYVWGA